MTTRTTVLLAAVIYDAGSLIDQFMASIARTLNTEGIRAGGIIQENAREPGSNCLAMTLIDLRTTGRFEISQDLGAGARGCRLNPNGLADAGAGLEAALDGGFDLLVLNKFGKAEAEGNGLRSTFARAIERGIPVLTAVRPPYTDAWSNFHGGLAAELAPNSDAVLAWCRRAVRGGDTSSSLCSRQFTACGNT